MKPKPVAAWQHDRNTPLPAPDKVQAEIAALKTWVEAVAQKQKAVRPV